MAAEVFSRHRRAQFAEVIDQQFTIARQILAAGLMPIVEPEVDIHATDKQGAEQLLKAAILDQLVALGPQQQVMLVLGKGPIPTFAPPFVPVGPVVSGDNIAAPGHLST